MNKRYYEERSIGKTDAEEIVFDHAEFENCTFKNLDLSSGDLSGTKFINCSFIGCNLSLARLTNTALTDVHFIQCKMMGLHFHDTNEFGRSFDFDHCVLDHSVFYQMKLRKLKITHTQLHEVDFTSADLTEAVFDQCDLSGARFDNTILEKADFRTALNFLIDPERNRIKKAKFSTYGLSGLLSKYDLMIE